MKNRLQEPLIFISIYFTCGEMYKHENNKIVGIKKEPNSVCRKMLPTPKLMDTKQFGVLFL